MSSIALSSAHFPEVHFQEKVALRDELATFLGLPSGSTLSRQDITKYLVAYCKEKGLMDGQTIHPDAALAALLDVLPGDYMCVLNLSRYMWSHYQPSTRPEIRFQDKVLLSDDLAAFLDLPAGSTLVRQDMTKCILAYCKENGLMDGAQTIRPDAALAELFGLLPGEYVCITNLNRYLHSHYVKA
jgi:chromatin remodeling complex protein RSC6